MEDQIWDRQNLFLVRWTRRRSIVRCHTVFVVHHGPVVVGVGLFPVPNKCWDILVLVKIWDSTGTFFYVSVDAHFWYYYFTQDEF